MAAVRWGGTLEQSATLSTAMIAASLVGGLPDIVSILFNDHVAICGGGLAPRFSCVHAPLAFFCRYRLSISRCSSSRALPRILSRQPAVVPWVLAVRIVSIKAAVFEPEAR